ncbi:MAG: hypothetical protein VCB59_10645, partial [Gammaproteobacteria bacterium]
MLRMPGSGIISRSGVGPLGAVLLNRLTSTSGEDDVRWPSKCPAAQVLDIDVLSFPRLNDVLSSTFQGVSVEVTFTKS